MPCFSHAAYLPEALESIVGQTRLPDEVIFIDDHSPDGTAQIVRAFVDGPSWPALVRHQLLTNAENLGQAASLNRGIEAANSDLVMVLNDDDYLMHDAVESMLAIFARNPGIALAGAGSVGFGGGDSLASMAKLSTAYGPADLPVVLRRPEDVVRYRRPTDLNMTHSSSCFHRLAWKAVGGYTPDRARRVVPFSDRDFQLRVNALWPVAVAEQVPLVFWRNDSSVDRLVNS